MEPKPAFSLFKAAEPRFVLEHFEYIVFSVPASAPTPQTYTSLKNHTRGYRQHKTPEKR
jgi:hypothetical protein